MSAYDAVIWFSGVKYGSYRYASAGPNSTDEANFAAYLNQGGNLFLSSPDYYNDMGLSSFLKTYLGVDGMTSFVSTAHAAGANAFAGLGPYALNRTFSDYSDTLSVNAGGTVAFSGDAGDIAAYTANTTFFAFPFEAIDSAPAREAVLQAILDRFAITTRPTLAANATITVDVEVQVAPDATGSLSTEVSASNPLPDFDPSNNSAVATTGVVTVFMVNTLDDVDDGACTTGHCSLREAINAANALAPGGPLAQIRFDLPAPFIIQPTSALPALTAAVTLDGASNPGGPVILDGGGAGPGAAGLTLASDGSSISGLEIRAFSGNGISVLDGVHNLLTGNSLHDNGGLGIDLGGDGVTPNDFQDGDSGANDLLNAPILQRAVISGTSTLVQGFVSAAPNSDYTVDFYRNTACDPTFYGEGETYFDSLTLTTNDAGYAPFLLTHNGVLAAGQIVTALGHDTGGNTSEFARCVAVGPNNDAWANAYPLALTSTGDPRTLAGGAQHTINLPGQSRWYRFPVMPGSKIVVHLTDLPANYDLMLFGDIAKTYADLQQPQGADDLVKLNARFSPEMFSPEMFSPEMFSPEMFSPEMFSPEMFSPEMFSPEMFSPEMFSPEMFSPEMFSPEMFSPEMFSPEMFSPEMFSPEMFSPEMFSPEMFSPEMFSPDQRYFSSAQRQSAIAVSGFDGTADETIVAHSWNKSGDFYVRVRGRNGVFDPGAAFTLAVTLVTGECSAINPSLHPDLSGITAGNTQTLILTDYSRMRGDLSSMQSKLAGLAAAVDGVIVDVGQDAAIQAANQQADQYPDCVYAKNLVAGATKEIVDAYRAVNPIKYIVLVGNDDVIPFFRYPDQALLASESGYEPPVRDQTASQASLRLGYVLGQDEYGASITLDRRNTTIPIPDLAVGRLVETPSDIVAVIDAFLGLSGGVVPTPTNALVTGYDFLADGAEAVQAEFEAGLGESGNVDTLIAPADVSPLGPGCLDGHRSGLGPTRQRPPRSDLSRRPFQRYRRPGRRLQDPAHRRPDGEFERRFDKRHRV